MVDTCTEVCLHTYSKMARDDTSFPNGEALSSHSTVLRFVQILTAK